MFEYGCGNSTLFFSNFVQNVVSVECNLEWYDYVDKTLPDNVELILCDPFDSETYSKIIQQQGKKFNVAVVDAKDRVNSLINAQQLLTDKGVLNLDDAKGEDSRSVIEHLLKQGFNKLDFEGLKPGRTGAIEQPFSTKKETVLESNHMPLYCTPLYSPTQGAKQRLETSRVGVTKKFVPLLGAVTDSTITDD